MACLVANAGFADIDGDGLDDYVWLHPDTGAITVHINKGPSQDDVLGWRWSPLYGGQPIASGRGRAATVQLADINGDGKADYVCTSAATGRARVWYNNYPKLPAWLDGGEIVSGVGTSGNCVRWAELQRTGRASYVAVNPTTGAIAAWLNGCDDLVPKPPPEIPCNDDPVFRRVPGELVCYRNTEFLEYMSCEECLGRNGYSPAKSGSNTCVVVTDTQGNYRTIACPGDPAAIQESGRLTKPRHRIDHGILYVRW